MATRQSKLFNKHKLFEKHTFILLLGILMVVAIGGLIEIVPLFYLKNTIEKVEGMRPYTPLELTGRNIYMREGCYLCHSQMVRPFVEEALRYGKPSTAGEFIYDHPFLWGSKRSGPDLHRVGPKYPVIWHAQHFTDPNTMSPGSRYQCATPTRKRNVRRR